ncbi:MAG: hypothetical protein P0S94_00140 [Simkaniaceae bacterium]|nr:hypothetical protein [Simkaniaceae bacterium]
MTISIDVSWNQGKSKGKLVIDYDYTPKKIFEMPPEKIFAMQKMAQDSAQEGPPIIAKYEAYRKAFPKSLYAMVMHFQVLEFFQMKKQAAEIFLEMKKKFPDEVFTRCIAAEYMLKHKKLDEFPKAFRGVPVLKGAFPKRRRFFFEEVLMFHNLWGQFQTMKGDDNETGKHAAMIQMVMETFESFQSAQAGGPVESGDESVEISELHP